MDRCPCAYSSESWDALSERVNAMPYVKQRKSAPAVRACARELSVRACARTAEPARDYANLTKSVTVVGCNNHAELWDSDAWQAVFEERRHRRIIAAVMEGA